MRDRCLCLHAQRAARALARRFDAGFRPFGITSGQFSLLMALNRPQPAPLGAVAALLAMDRTTLTAALKPLERRGLVVVAQSRDGPPQPGSGADQRRPRAAARGRAGLAGGPRGGRPPAGGEAAGLPESLDRLARLPAAGAPEAG